MNPKGFTLFKLSCRATAWPSAVRTDKSVHRLAYFLFDIQCNICYIYNRGANKLCAKVKLNAGKENMTKIIRLNNETISLIEEARRILKEEFNEKQLNNMTDVLKNDNLIIQSALRTFIEFDTFIPKKSK